MVKVGDKIRLKRKWYTFNEVGDVLTVDRVGEVWSDKVVGVKAENHPRPTDTPTPDYIWHYFMEDCEIVGDYTIDIYGEPTGYGESQLIIYKHYSDRDTAHRFYEELTDLVIMQQLWETLPDKEHTTLRADFLEDGKATARRVFKPFYTVEEEYSDDKGNYFTIRQPAEYATLAEAEEKYEAINASSKWWRLAGSMEERKKLRYYKTIQKFYGEFDDMGELIYSEDYDYEKFVVEKEEEQ